MTSYLKKIFGYIYQMHKVNIIARIYWNRNISFLSTKFKKFTYIVTRIITINPSWSNYSSVKVLILIIQTIDLILFIYFPSHKWNWISYTIIKFFIRTFSKNHATRTPYKYAFFLFWCLNSTLTKCIYCLWLIFAFWRMYNCIMIIRFLL